MVAPFDLFAPHSAATLVLVGARVTGLMLIAPALAATAVPRLVKVGAMVLFTVLLQPAVLPLVEAPALTVGAVAAEVLIGLAIGLGAAIIIGAAETAGDVMAVQIGLSGSAILDPIDTSAQMPVLGIFTRMFAVTLLLTLDLHQVMLLALAESFTTLVPGTPVSLAGGLAEMVRVGSALFAIGVRFAAPVIAAVLLANVALAILTRAAPQINLLSVSFPVQIALGLFALAAAIPAMGRTLTGWPTVYRGLLTGIGDGFLLAPR
jgi:flagellar biosynthetic protein FliR